MTTLAPDLRVDLHKTCSCAEVTLQIPPKAVKTCHGCVVVACRGDECHSLSLHSLEGQSSEVVSDSLVGES